MNNDFKETTFSRSNRANVHVNSESMEACKRSAQVKGRWGSIPARGKWTSGPAPNQEVTCK